MVKRYLSPVILQVDNVETGEVISAYAFNPEAIYGASHIAILPSHRLLHGGSNVRGVLQEAFTAGKGEKLQRSEVTVDPDH